MAEATYTDGTSASIRSTDWIFSKFDPGIEYRSKPESPDIVQRRGKATYARYRLHFGVITFASREGKTAAPSSLESTNGNAEGSPTTGTPSGGNLYILSDHALDNEGGQGSGMWRETQVWETYGPWEDWETLEDDLGYNPLS
jgi:hypothetical protein